MRRPCGESGSRAGAKRMAWSWLHAQQDRGAWPSSKQRTASASADITPTVDKGRRAARPSLRRARPGSARAPLRRMEFADFRPSVPCSRTPGRRARRPARAAGGGARARAPPAAADPDLSSGLTACEQRQEAVEDYRPLPRRDLYPFTAPCVKPDTNRPRNRLNTKAIEMATITPAACSDCQKKTSPRISSVGIPMLMVLWALGDTKVGA